jgi:hypothetical protein
LVLIATFLSQDWNLLLPVMTVGLAGIGIVLGCGNISSVFLPQRVRQMQRGFQASGSSLGTAGCMRALLSMVLMMVTVVLLVPVGLALFLPLFFHMSWVWVFSVPAALIYAVVFHQLVTYLVAPRMLARTPEILEITTRE